ncbi:MAG: valine--tRNA ligase [Planctomyces sp.]|nr:valine--tRNA ligase [Planctomyces sp.]
MTTEIPKSYDPQAAEAHWYTHWEEHGYFNADPSDTKPPHVIMIPLPNVTGALHMGHALNGTLQDLITRWRRMQGYSALWMPGTDHAGIATQSMVERRMLEEEGLTRHDVGREALIQRIWKWKDHYEARILGQLKRLGASCDWRRTRFTLDEVCSQAVRRTFFKMFRDGLIYRGQRLVNWDAFLQTAVADDEVSTDDIDGQFWTFSYPVVNDQGEPTGQRISFSTTRPETMLGDTALCVHPTDERYTALVGKHVRLPLVGRLVPIIADGLLADKELGTGCVKVTPAHDPNDYACGLRNKLPMINILRPDGTINEEGGEFAGLDRLEARKAVVAKMESLGFFEKVEDRKIPMKFSDRSKTPVEPLMSDQWFVKMDDLAQKAIDAVTDGRVKFFPERYQSSYLDWLGEKRDWCISRQLWWGHRIPVWSKQFASASEAEAYLAAHPDSSAAAGVLSASDPASVLVCVDASAADGEQTQKQLEAEGFEQDPDVLDTWFSSALWPHATLGWPNETTNPPLNNQPDPSGDGKNTVLPYFYPGSVLITSRDIITLWVARMVLTGLYNLNDIPFKHVHIHPKIQDGFGQGMSKTKGNGVDPLELVDRYGCDGTRFTIASFAGETQDVRLPVSYACPHCENLIPQEQKHLKFQPGKPKIKCAKCKKESQYATPWYAPDEGELVAGIVIERFEFGRNFCNKLWNAARFAMLNLEGYTPAAAAKNELAIEDQWIVSRLATVTNEVTSLLGVYKFDAATRALRDFVWNEFCDWYLELIKSRLRDETTKPVAQRVLVHVLDQILRLLHPFTPFITEELWHRLAEIAPSRGLPEPQPAETACIIAAWPMVNEADISPPLEQRFTRLQETIGAIRNIRATYGISPGQSIGVQLKCSVEAAADFEALRIQIQNLAKAEIAAVGPEVSRPPASASFTLAGAEGFVPLEGLINKVAELAKQTKEAEKLRGFIAATEKKLGNASFVDKAPPEVVAEVRQTLANQKAQVLSIEEIIRQLQ